MIRLKGKDRRPAEVWTGSTNISLGGIHGQTNVGHWIRNPVLASKYRAYWDLLRGDPGAKGGNDAAETRRKNAEFRSAVEAIQNVPTALSDIPVGVTPVFSPRSGLRVLDLYFDLVDTACDCACITLAFGVNKAFKEKLRDNTSRSAVVFMMLEKKDEPNPRNRGAYITVNARNNIYKAWGSYLREPLYQWIKETNAKNLRLNQHVAYVHSKFLLRDPLGDDPVIVTGSANFSDSSTNANDENMVIIRGDRRAADIYFTEFHRVFNHYYFRSVTEATEDAGAPASEDNLFLKEKPEEWLAKYEPGKLRQKRVDIFAKMKGFATS
jgi:phosphatidylserine/phosphatidylglycerophosphate/cardiolipin synthase-like enzyme